ncbi:COG1361 S-layer family protein [Nanoarchaeota archaeon]
MKKTYYLGLLVMILLINSMPAIADGKSPDLSVTLLDYTPNPVQPGQIVDIVIQIANEGGVTDGTSLEIIEEYPFTLEHTEDIERAKDLGPVSSRVILQFRLKVDNNAKDGLHSLKVRYWPLGRTDFYSEEVFDINVQTFDAHLDLFKVEQYPKELIPGEQGKLILSLQNHDDKPISNVDINLDLTNSYDININMENMISVQAMINARLEEVNRRVAAGQSPLLGPTPMGLKEDGTPQEIDFKAFAPVGAPNQKTIQNIEGKEIVEAEFDIMALPDISPDVYAIPVYMSYNDEDNNPFHVRVDIPIVVNMEPELYLEMKSTTLRTPDFAGNIVLSVANRGLSELRYVTLELEDDESIQVLTAPESVYLGALGQGDSKEANFTIIAHDKNITIPVKVKYRDSFNQEHEEVRNINFYIINKNYYRDLPYEMWLAWLILGIVILVLTIFYVKHMKKE